MMSCSQGCVKLHPTLSAERLREEMSFEHSFIPPFPSIALGPLESEVMLIVSRQGTASVQDVREQLSRPLAYTTVMTTLDRLFKKNLLDRRKSGRGFVYTTSSQLPTTPLRPIERPTSATAGLISYLVDAVSSYDEAVLDELEKKIAERRQKFANDKEDHS